MRRMLAAIVITGCTIAPTPPPAPKPPTSAALYGLTIEEEAHVLALEDRREYDPAFVDSWLHHPNPLHRARIALALGRIGPHTFIDSNGNGERDSTEHQAGVEDLAGLANDPDPQVRVMAAFALGQIGDIAGTDTLLQLATDRDNAGVAAEAVEALSKLAPRLPLQAYVPFTAATQREGIRARAIRYLFRFGSDEASAIAADALEAPSPAIRQEAVYALARRAYPPARARLELLLGDPNVLTRAYAARALGAITASDSLQPLLAALSDHHPWVRTNAIVAIARISLKNPAALGRPDDAIRVVTLTEDLEPGTRASSIDALGACAAHNDLAKKRLLEIASSGSRWERELAAGAIARQFNDERLLPGDLTNWARVRVLEAGSDLSERVRPAYAHDPDPLVRENALRTIPDARADAYLPLIRAALDDPDAIVRGYAIDRFAKSSDPAKLEALTAAELRARKDSQDDARLAAIQGLAEIDFPDREKFLRNLLRDDDSVVRRLAADLIEQKLKKPRPQYTPLPVQRTDYEEVVRWSRQPHTATIHMARGRIVIALLTQDAPMTAWNFAQLARKHFFDNTSFMRVVPNFVIQGGDPRNDTEGGPGYAIRDEINLQKYTRATVGMALSGPDTGGSQFFITHSPQPHLDGGYTVFGRVTEGMDSVVDQIERGDRVETITIDESARALAQRGGRRAAAGRVRASLIRRSAAPSK